MPLIPYRRRFKTPEQKTDANGMIMFPESEPLNFDSLKKFLEARKRNQAIPTGKPNERRVLDEVPRPNSGLGEDFISRPKLYDEQGKLNPRYDSSIGADMMTGLGRGVQVGLSSGRSSLFGIASALGGLAGGAFSKNIAGADKYSRDVKMADAENDSIYQQTEARRRIEALKSEQDNRKQQQANAATRTAIYQLRVSNLNNTAKIKQLDTFAQTADLTPEARAEIAKQRAELSGIELGANDVDENYGLKIKPYKAGDYTYNVDQFGTFRSAVDSETGQPISNMTSAQQLSALAQLSKLNQDTDKLTLQQALDQAGQVMKTSFSGGLKPAQANSLKLQIASKILANNKAEKPRATDELTVGEKQYYIDLTPFPILNKGQQTPSQRNPSPFMPDENFYEGVPEGAIQDVKTRFTNPADIQNAISEVDKELQNSKNSPETQANYVQYRKALEGRMKEIGGTYDATGAAPAATSNETTYKVGNTTYTKQGDEQEITDDTIKALDNMKVNVGGTFKAKDEKTYRRTAKNKLVEVK